MCGIVGWLGASFHKESALQMSNSLSHRGPDGDGEWQEGDVWLAQRRLAIVDLSPAGRQPMVSSTDRYVITYNGEIYNAPELALELTKYGQTFRGHSDTEVILAAFDFWGVEKSIERFNGMFAFAVWDRLDRTLTLARDRIGEKPLYYTESGAELAFASELTALWHVPWLDRRLDRSALAAYFRYLCVPAPATILIGVRKLEPGTLYRWHNGQGKVHSYWSVADVAAAGIKNRLPIDMRTAADELDRLAGDAVRLRLRSDVPYGAFLSGGLDSSLVAALMQKESGIDVKTFTIGFDEKSHDESIYARAVAKHLGTNHHEQILSPQDVIALVPQVSSFYDEPFADSSSIPTALLSRFARQHVTVALSGDGGDELFGGYPRYFWAGRIEKLRRRLSSPGAWAVGRVLQSLPVDLLETFDRKLLGQRFGGANGLGDRVNRFGSYLRYPSAELYRSIVSAWKSPEDLISGSVIDNLEPDESKFVDMNWAERMMAVDQENYLPDDILTKMDRATMSTGLEGRAPLLDHRLIEWAWRVPSDLKLSPNRDVGKLLMREVLYRYVPRELLDRPKMGFGMPVGKWLRYELRAWADSLLDPVRLENVGLNSKLVRATWSDHLSGSNRLGEIWTVLMWVQWQERWKAIL